MTTSSTSTTRELTVRSVVLGGLITLVFTAANVYLGLKVGLTFATAIPAAVISMAILRYFRGHSILENNIVQTIASAAGTLAAIIFVLPGLIMIGWWQGFPYWTTVAVCVIGGTLGVMYSVPLRRALVTGSDLPYPEGVAAAEVLKVGEATEHTAEGAAEAAEGNRRGLQAILIGSLASAGFSLLAALKVVGNEVSAAFRVGSGGTLFGASLSLALIGVGHLVGVTVGVAMLVGLLISYGILLPTLTWGDLPSSADVSDVVSTTFGPRCGSSGPVRSRVAAVWTLLKILGPIVRGIRAAAVSSAARRGGGTVDLTERDLPIGIVGGTIAVSLIPIAALLWWFLSGTPLAGTRRADDRGQPRLHRGDRRGDRGRRRVHGRAHRLVQQPDLRGGHPRRAGHRAAAGGDARIRRRPGADHGPGRLRAVHHGGGVLGRHDLQRQPAGPEDRPARRRDPVEAAGRPRHRRGLRGAGDRAGARPAQHGVRFRRGAGGRGERAGRTPGGTDLGAGRRACSGAT